MRHTRTETREVEVVEDVTCDRCGKSMRSEIGNINGITLSGCGAYDSTHFPDMSSVKADVCEECSSEWFKTFKVNPVKFWDE